MSRPRRFLGVAAQAIALSAGVWFLLRTAQRSWGSIALAELTPAWIPILAGSALTSATYLYLVLLWVASLRWWGQRFAYLDAARVWFVSNLARFIPGMVWQLVGVAAMSHARDVSPVAATGGVLLQQIVLVVTGLVITAAWSPALLTHWTGTLPTRDLLGLTGLGVVVLVVLLPRAIPWLGRAVRYVLGRDRPLDWPALPTRGFAAYVVGLCVPWVVYGVAFWLFGLGLLGAQAPGLRLAVGAFVASYVAGLIVVFAPSGLVVREAAMVAALAPSVGGGAALVLAIGSRVWLLAVELLTALLVVALNALVRRGRHP